MKELFNYTIPGLGNEGSQILVLKIGDRLRSAVLTDPSWSKLYQVMYNTAQPSSVFNWEDMEKKYPWLNASYSKVHIVVDYPNCMLVPANRDWKEDAAGLLNTMLGYCEDEMILEETLPGQDTKIIYTIPKDTHTWLHRKFPNAGWTHARALSLLKLAREEEGMLMADFHTSTFSLVAGKQDDFLLTRIYEYETPEDVLFYLLQACKFLSLKPTTVSLQLSGLIDKDSALYKELFLYFINITLRDAQWQDESGLPAHFFTSFNDVSVCVS